MSNGLAIKSRCTTFVLCVLTAAALVACGGGGGSNSAGNGSGSGSNQPGNPVDGEAPVTPQPTPDTSPIPPEAGTAISADTTAQRNTRYDVTATGGVVTLTLPAFAAVGDFVSIRGLAGSSWQLAHNPVLGVTPRSDLTPQAIYTETLPGNVLPGRIWAGQGLPGTPVALASDETGQLLIAALGFGGALQISTDAGVSWASVASPAGQNWVSVAASTPPYPMILGVPQSLLAAAAGGGLYRSTSQGSAWSALSSDIAGVDFGSQDWRAVATDQGAQTIAAAVFNGPIYRYGATPGSLGPIWRAATLVGSDLPLIRPWRGVASSDTSGVMVAVTEAGEVFVSETGGQSWQLRSVTLGGAPLPSRDGQWSQVAISASGNTIAVAGERDSGLYLSRDRGLSWTQAATPVGNYSGIAISADGAVIGASLDNAGLSPPGDVQISRDGGLTFAAIATLPESRSGWRGLTMSNDGTQYVAASGASVFTSVGNRSSIGASGAIAGGANDFVEVEFLGNARYRVRQFQGGPFTIR